MVIAGVPRKWGKHDDLTKLFTSARDEALLLLELFSDFQLPRVSVGMADPRRPVPPPQALSVSVSSTTTAANAVSITSPVPPTSLTSSTSSVPPLAATITPPISDTNTSVDGVTASLSSSSAPDAGVGIATVEPNSLLDSKVMSEVDPETAEMKVLIPTDQRDKIRRQFVSEIESPLAAARYEQQVAMQSQTISTPMLLLIGIPSLVIHLCTSVSVCRLLNNDMHSNCDIAYLGWDDLIDALTNPFKLVFLLFVGGTGMLVILLCRLLKV
jgi:hypothetical protein